MTMVKSLLFNILTLGSFRNVEHVKARAAEGWKQAGFEIAGYDGYMANPIFGGAVWYFLKREDTPGAVYRGYLVRWFDEIHTYNVELISGNQFNITDVRN